MHYPPFTVLALILVRDKNLAAATETIDRFAELLQGSRGPEIRILGPTQSPLARIRSEHRFQLLIKSRSRSRLRTLPPENPPPGSDEGTGSPQDTHRHRPP